MSINTSADLPYSIGISEGNMWESHMIMSAVYIRVPAGIILSRTKMLKKLLVDVHTHVYLPRYADLLRSRAAVPRIIPAATGSTDSKPSERLLILDHEPSGGRPVGPQYWSRDEKLGFMDKHGIDVSIVR